MRMGSLHLPNFKKASILLGITCIFSGLTCSFPSSPGNRLPTIAVNQACSEGNSNCQVCTEDRECSGAACGPKCDWWVYIGQVPVEKYGKRCRDQVR